MIKKIGLGILITVFLISGLASMGTEQAIYNELTEIPDADINEVNFDREFVGTENSLENDVETSISTRAIDIDLKDIYWSKMINNRKAFAYQVKATEYSDLNHDGLIDIVDGGGYGIFVSFQNPDGTWYSMNTGLPLQFSSNYDIYDMELCDMNCDGWDDIVAINYTSNAGGDRPIIYLNNNGTSWSGQFSLGFEIASNSRGLTVNDFNNDKIPDIAYLGSGAGVNNKIVIYIQDPIGTWTKSQTFDSLGFVFANSMTSFDYNNDANMDIVAGGVPYGKFYIVTNNNGSGVNWTNTEYTAPSASSIYWGYLLSTYTADLNLDGYQDLVFGVYPSNDRNIITMYYNGTSWNEHLGNLPYFGNYGDFHIGDINFDGKPDITASGDGGLDVFLGDANYNWTQLNQGLSSDSLANCIVDLDNDGVLEIVDSDGLYDTIGLDNLYIKNFNKLTSNLPLGESFAFSHGDVNHDGLLDLLALRNKGVSANNVIVYTNKGDGTWKFYSAPSSSTTGILDGHLADMDHDGDMDIIYASEMYYSNVILVRNAGDGTFPGSKEEIYSVPKVSNRGGRAYSVDCGDVDNDGDLDVLAPGEISHIPAPPQKYSLWLIKNNSGVWEKENITTSSSKITNAKFVDIDDDTYLDIISYGSSGYDTKVFLYNTSTTNWDEHSTGLPTTTINCIDYGDINNDRVLEIIVDMKIYSWNSTSLGWDQIYNFAQTCVGNYFMDLNFDGLKDVIQLHSSFIGGFTVWTNKGNNIWAKGVYQNPNSDYFQEIDKFDYNWDGTNELFLGSPDVGIRIYELDIKQDETELSFSDPSPSSDTWLASTTVSPSVTISDIEGSGVDGYTIEYAIKKHSQGVFGSWTPYPTVPADAQEINVQVWNIDFEEGTENFIKWRAKDMVGNGYTESESYQLMIDVSNPYFQNENPPSDRWVNSQSQTLSVQVNDDWSGLDAPSIKYKLDTGNGFGEWISAGENNDGNTLVPSTIAYLSEGINQIYWVAYDNVGHGVKSPVYTIKLDTQPTVFKSPDPEEGEWMTNSSFKCSVNIFDSGINGSGVNSSAIQFRYSTAGLFEYGIWTDATDLYDIEDGQNFGVHVNTTTIDFLEGTNNYIQYQALDKATNGYTPSPDYNILVDTTNVTFANPLPTPDDWQSSNEVKCYITIEDIDGSEVDGTSAEYWVVKNDPDPENATSNWTKAVTQISAQSVTFDATIELPQGIYNYVKWRAKDIAGNGFTESGWYQIKVDSTGIQFSSPDPLPDEWRKSTTVGAQIIVTIDTDPNFLDYSNPKSVEYRYSTSGVTNYGSWNVLDKYLVVDAKTLLCAGTLNLIDGTENYVQWRAKENVSEEYTLSDHYQVKVDTVEVTFVNPKPTPNDWQNTQDVECFITIEDIGGSGTDGSNTKYQVVEDNPNPGSVPANWTQALTQPSSESVTFSATVELPDSIYNWIRWAARDVAGNGWTISGWNQIRVDTTPIQFSSPMPTSEEWQTSIQVNASIVVAIDTDPDFLDYSNPQSLQYRSSTTGVLGFGSWQTVDSYTIIDNTTLQCEAYLSLSDGTDNYVQWRALENVSDGIPVSSSAYQIKVDSTALSYTNPVPTSNTINEVLEITCYITVQDTGSSVDGSSVQYRYSINGSLDAQFTDWNNTVSQPNGQSITFSVTLEFVHGTNNYIQWAAKDAAGIGPIYSSKYQIKVNFIDFDGDGIADKDDYDDDNDGVLDTQDAFPYDASEWLDTDSDGTGDNADTDDDNDGVPDSSDAFPTNPNEYADSDSDGIGDNSDSDDDNDGVPDLQDDFPYNATEWSDTDSDGIGDNSDNDIDGDGYNNTNDAFPSNEDEWADLDSDGTGDNSDTDIDGDGYINANDKFPFDNTEWLDTDNDATGDNTDTDDDNDGVPDGSDAFPTNPAEYSDWDSDGIGDNSDSDDDNDGVPDLQDKFQYNATEWADTDNDGIGDNSDSDIDGDGYNNTNDEFPNDADEWADLDGDGTGDNSDTDIDGDGYINANDKFPFDNTEWQDSDNDGTGDNTDTDDDNDGVLDVNDAFPTNSAEYADNDQDGIGDNSDSDDDNDGIADLQDKFPYDSSEWADTDNDGTGDNTDPDIDGDGYANADDQFPTNPDEWDDYDGDGFGDNSDADDDNDGFTDVQDKFPKDSSEWADMDGDGEGDNSDDDVDGDGYNKTNDAFPTNPNEWIDSDGDGIGDNSDPDIDGDGYLNANDWDPSEPSEWLDTDKDGEGNNQDTDDDDDGVDDGDDAFPTNPAEYSDWDGDGIGDNSDSDDDNDGVADLLDKFPNNATEWSDSDSDGIGDNTDDDIDGDGHLNVDDAFPTNPNEWKDSDGDGIGDNSDADRDGDGYPNTNDDFPNDDEEWVDTDNDEIGDNTDPDIDNDGSPNTEDEFDLNPNEYLDNDGDGIGDNSDSDDDNDGIPDLQDDFPTDDKEWLDSDNDGYGDNTDPDDDNDGYNDTADELPNNPNEWEDTDGDGVGDNTDTDIDGDGYPNNNDDFPENKFEWFDTDGDGIGNNADDDNDDDGFNDTFDEFPNDPDEWYDFDGDGIGDNSDADKDGDGYPNTNDPFPSDPTEWIDTDGDEIGNNQDDDDDGDGYNDTNDEFPTNPNEWKDTDADGIGDNADVDDDNDGMPDYDDFAPLDKKVQSDPNLIRIAGVEFEIGELVMGIMMGIGAVFIGTFAFTRKKRLYNRYKNQIEDARTVNELNAVNTEIKIDMEREKLTNIQLTMLKEQYDEKYMELRKKELNRKLGKLPSKVEDSIREVIKDKIITEDELSGMSSWLARLRDSKDFDSGKKAKLQGVLRDWIDENVQEDWDAPDKTRRKRR